MLKLNNKEIKLICRHLEEQFGIKSFDLKDYFFYKNKESKLYLISKNISEVDLTRFNVSSLGLYFGKIEDSGLRLSISGTQLIGYRAEKNIFEIDKIEEWLNGKNLECDINIKGWFIIKHKKYFLGCGYCKNGVIINFIPKKH